VALGRKLRKRISEERGKFGAGVLPFFLKEKKKNLKKSKNLKRGKKKKEGRRVPYHSSQNLFFCQ